MKSTLDYGCSAYMSAAETNLKKLDIEQAEALRIYSGAFKTSPGCSNTAKNWGDATEY
ncbi:RNA-directed DNA polymerase from mobile element jockey [Labeo rohita]|uniref:RNA-directed DNA polymerase from mobile element jockey n=1 Tax=Labeo rohita TaxID=84645 RepID=A0ABQ8L6B4_LABRO|nr:RNA-directed DNA polymerase from mobile element jockey [Labeo rohita]